MRDRERVEDRTKSDRQREKERGLKERKTEREKTKKIARQRQTHRDRESGEWTAL